MERYPYLSGIIMIIVIIIPLLPYGINGYKLSQCDFKSDYKCEILHGMGVIVPPTAFITVWFKDDND